MTEAEWLTCDDPRAMLEFLRGKATGRPLAFFAVACCLADPCIMRDARSRRAILWSERLLDGLVRLDDPDGPSDGDCYLMGTVANRCMAVAIDVAEGDLAAAVGDVFEMLGVIEDSEDEVAALLLRKAASFARCVFGNPFAALKFDTAWLAWNEGIVPRLAEGIYADRGFDRLPILADALEEAGCADDALLSHLRSPGPHVRGCWAVDLLLGKQ
jgi:hypothetical protein